MHANILKHHSQAVDRKATYQQSLNASYILSKFEATKSKFVFILSLRKFFNSVKSSLWNQPHNFGWISFTEDHNFSVFTSGCTTTGWYLTLFSGILLDTFFQEFSGALLRFLDLNLWIHFRRLCQVILSSFVPYYF